MRILIDEDLDVRLRYHFSAEIEVETVQHRGWSGLKNGELLEKASKEFAVLLTMDNSLPEQQNLQKFDIAVVILRSESKDLKELIELVPEVERVLPSLRPHQAVRILPSQPGPAETG
ncbi:MAG: DUF5615 family PIN-like protein [Gemmatimonadota bacterium]